MTRLSSAAFAEFLGTFILVFIGTGSIVANDVTGGLISHAGVASAFGLAVLTMIYAIGDISGAHINPAVTIAFWLAGRFPLRRVPIYIASQLVGALAGSALIFALFPIHGTLGATLPSGISLWSTVLLEVTLTFILMFVIIHVAEGAKEKGLMAGVAVGGTVAMAALIAGPLSGASMNPARSFGPAILSGHIEGLWVYLIAPVVGAALAVLSCRLFREDCCSSNKEVAHGRAD